MTTIRFASEADAAQIAAIYAPYVRDAATSFEIDPPTTEEMRRRIRTTLEQLPWLVCDKDGTVLGYAYANKHRERAAYGWSVDVTIYNHDSAHRRGVGRALYTTLLQLVTAQGYFNAYAGITLPNPASVALHEALGFKQVGVYRSVGHKLEHWHDVGWWELHLQTHGHSPQPPRSLDALRQSTAFDDALGAGIRHLRI